MASGPGGIDRGPGYILEPIREDGPPEDSNSDAATPAGSPSSVVGAEGRAGDSSPPLPPSAPPSGEPGGALDDLKGKNVAETSSPGRSSSYEQGESSRGARRKTFLNKVLCRKGFNQSSTGSSSNEPHVDEQKFHFDDAFAVYYNEILLLHTTKGAVATNVFDLRDNYSHFRKVEGDGECFYRSFIFSYLEQVLDRQDTNEELRLLRAIKEVAREDILLGDVEEMDIARLGWTSNFSRSCIAFENLVEKVMSWKTRGPLNLVASAKSYRTKKLLNFFSTYDKTQDIFVFLRSAAAIRICSESVDYEYRLRELGEDCSAQDWCIRRVTPPGSLADAVQIRALATALGVPITVETLRAAPGVHYGSLVSPLCAYVLLTLDHYDIIYPKTC